MGEVFKKDISFISQVFDIDSNVFIEQVVTKEATFLELSRTDKNQHKLHFMLFSIFKSNGDDEAKIDSDQMYDITVRFVKNCMVIPEDKSFTEQEKVEFLNDGVALLKFGTWLLSDKIAPFFTQLALK